MADKTAGDYAVEIEAVMATSNTLPMDRLAPILADMRAHAAPVSEDPPPPPVPVDLGLAVYANDIEFLAQANNVAQARALCADMKAVAPPTPPVEPPPEAPAEQPSA